jgi:hypothetical protein
MDGVHAEAARDVATTSASPAARETEVSLQKRASGSAAKASAQPDEFEELIVDMPPILLILAHRLLVVDSAFMPIMPMTAAPGDSWEQRERTDLMTLVMRLWLLNRVMDQPAVLLSDLLGGMNVGANDVMLRVPSSGFMPEFIRDQLTRAEYAQQAQNMDAVWAFIGPGNWKVDSWMFLRTADGDVFSIQIQSKKRTQPQALSASAVANEAKKVFQARDVQHVLLFVTDQRKPKRKSSLLRFLSRRRAHDESVVVISEELHPQFYSGSMNLLKAALAAGSASSRKRTR